MKKAAYLILALALCVSLTACGHEHTWLEATCIEPRTCSECGETEGEALEHNWQDATCTEPKICSRCGETEGEPLAHDWREANYQDPSTCTLCGETKGEPLTPYFVTYGIETMGVGVHYDYATACGCNPNVKTVGDLVVSDYTIDEYYYGQKAKDGYEYRVATFMYTFNDANDNTLVLSPTFMEITTTPVRLIVLPSMTMTEMKSGPSTIMVKKWSASLAKRS